ncbi:hypothetical protein DPMN_036057 [Dreissena polymorpha]|uniref:Uncharacterized protein n=1 Tax=Dreissena polymorpha TaxID=45954 RepID=A0A9D4RLL6_DREPO|nr:hypothetical protein DPMN_036057 [Dreissena polymorpha]
MRSFNLSFVLIQAFYEEDAPVKGSDLYTCASPVRVEELQYRYNYNISWSNLLNSLFNKTQFSHNYTICFTSLSTSVSDVISSFPFVTFKRYIILYVLLESDLYYLLPKEIQTWIYMKHMQRALFDADVSHNEYACAIHISRHLSFHYLFSSEIPAEFSNALGQTFKELASSVEAIIQDLYWMPHKQKQHLLTVLNGLYLQPEWVVNGVIMRLGQLGNVSDDYWRNMLLMTGYSSRMYLVGNPHNRLSTQGSNIFSFNDKVLGMLCDIYCKIRRYAICKSVLLNVCLNDVLQYYSVRCKTSV